MPVIDQPADQSTRSSVVLTPFRMCDGSQHTYSCTAAVYTAPDGKTRVEAKAIWSWGPAPSQCVYQDIAVETFDFAEALNTQLLATAALETATRALSEEAWQDYDDAPQPQIGMGICGCGLPQIDH